MSVTIDSSGQQHDPVDHPAAFADLHRQRISSDEGERASLIEGSVAELLDVLVEVGWPRG